MSYKKSEIITEGFEFSMPRELESDLRYFESQPNPDITVIQYMELNDQNALIVDVKTEEGVIRIGYYWDGATSVLDDCNKINSIEEWASSWDEPGDDPKFWNDNHLLPLFVRQVKEQLKKRNN